MPEGSVQEMVGLPPVFVAGAVSVTSKFATGQFLSVM